MKLRLLSLTLSVLLLLSLFSLSACTQKTEDPKDETPVGDTTPSPEPTPEPTPEPDVTPEPKPANKNTAPETLDVNGDGAVKILSLGNSFSVNTYKYLHPILSAYGVENLTLGNLYQPSCTLQTTAGFVNGSGTYASYYKYDTTGTRTETKNYSAQTAIAEEDWDIITVQQASGHSGRPASYSPYLDYIIEYVEENRTVKDGLLIWHMTWSYQQNSTHPDFANYQNDQMTMYNKIVETVEEVILNDEAFDMVIPAGTAIQNARTRLGDVMTKDGYHLNDRACFVAGYAWLTSLTGKTIDEIRYVPEGIGLDEIWIETALDSANAVVETPFAVTNVSKNG